MRLGVMILCGGKSSRMGSPKAMLPLAGQPLLLRMIERLRSLEGPNVVVAAAEQELPPLPADIEVVRDEAIYQRLTYALLPLGGAHNILENQIPTALGLITGFNSLDGD